MDPRAHVHRDGGTDRLDPYLLDVRRALEVWKEVAEISLEDVELIPNRAGCRLRSCGGGSG